MTIRPTHWTASRHDDFAACPKKYEARYVLKSLPFEQNAAAERGSRIHESIEHYLQGKRADVDREISGSWFNQIRDLKTHNAKAEESWEFSEGFHPVDRKHPKWLAMKIDAHYFAGPTRMRVIDFKTGKMYATSLEQIEIYALAAFAKYDKLETVSAELWYLDQEEPYEKEFEVSQCERIARKWEARAREMLEATTFKARPNKFCSWCPLLSGCKEGQTKGGFNGRGAKPARK
jgi:PD-(D/E)XK nuclease superfamily